MHTSVLIVHVIAGSTGLVLGPVAMRAVERRGPPTAVGSAYHWSVLAVCVSAVALAAFDPAGLWWFVPIAAGSYAGAAVGRWAARARPLGWMALHVHGIGGSYIALVTAVAVVSLPGFWPAWVLPTVIGAPLIKRAVARTRSSLRPSAVSAPAASALTPSSSAGRPDRFRGD